MLTMPRLVDLTGRQFGRLAVIERAPDQSDRVMWRCSCDCGAETVTHSASLRKGLTQSCGCLGRERRLSANTTHGRARGPEWTSWQMMRQRCQNPGATQYADYGGRGVTVCARWQDFTAFYADMGPRPEGMTLDRIDVNGNYEPGNCKWSTRSEQNRNKR